MRRLVELLRGRGHGRIALYGVNPQSVSDESRMDSYLAALGGEDGRRHVFFNSGSLENCFEQFMARAQQYDAVICANDFADRKSTRLNSSHSRATRMPSSA